MLLHLKSHFFSTMLGLSTSSLICFSLSHSHCAFLSMQTALNSHDLIGMYPCIPALDRPLLLSTLSQAHAHAFTEASYYWARLTVVISSPAHLLISQYNTDTDVESDQVWDHSHWSVFWSLITSWQSFTSFTIGPGLVNTSGPAFWHTLTLDPSSLCLGPWATYIDPDPIVLQCHAV